jgi:hypothetical protein
MEGVRGMVILLKGVGGIDGWRKRIIVLESLAPLLISHALVL